jgi:hypothetical protein
MKYQVKQAKNGKWQAIITNQSLGWSKVYNYDTERGAELRIEIEKQEVSDFMATVVKLSDYFNFKEIKS